MRISIVSLADPWAHSHGGTLRTRAFARAFTELGHDVSCLFPSAAGEEDLVDGVTRVPVRASALGARQWPGWVTRAKRAVLPMPTQVGGRSQAMLEQVREREPDMVVVSVLPYAWYADQVPGASLWLDHSDLYSDFIEREITSRTGPSRWIAGLQQRHLVSLESRSTREAAVTSTAGWADARLLAERVDRAVVWLPTPVTRGVSDVALTRQAVPTAGFLANFAFGPNLDALALLNRRWAPRLLEMGWRVVVAGLGSEDVDVADGVEVMGPLQDVVSFYDAVDVTLAPIRLGGGMKVKVVESLAFGRPVVGTGFAIAGFPDEFRDAVVVVDAEDPAFDELADGAPPLMDDIARILHPFTQRGFTETVRTALQPVTGRGSASVSA